MHHFNKICVFLLFFGILSSSFDLNDCPSGITSCPDGLGINSPQCCALASPVAGNYCCPAGYPNCGTGGCCPDELPTMCPSTRTCCSATQRCDPNGNCISGNIPVNSCDSQPCNSNETCCSSSVGKLCCPFPNAVCCGDSCCPNGYTCGTYNGTMSCLLPNSEMPDSTLDLKLKPPANDDSVYAFVPVSQQIAQSCADLASQLYCSYSEANAASVTCLMRQATGYCSIAPDSCWKIVPAGSICYNNESGCSNPIPGNCGWYIGCLQQKFQCATNGYPLSYGFRYCNKFQNYFNDFDSNGQKWILQVMVCLQKSLVQTYEAGNVDCDTLANIAFASHPECYTGVQPSFCDITGSLKNDYALWKVYNVYDLLSWRALLQEVQVILTCAAPDLPYILMALPLIIV